MLYDVDTIDREQKRRQLEERQTVEKELREVEAVGRGAGKVAEEIEDLIYRFKPDVGYQGEPPHHFQPSSSHEHAGSLPHPQQ